MSFLLSRTSVFQINKKHLLSINHLLSIKQIIYQVFLSVFCHKIISNDKVNLSKILSNTISPHPCDHGWVEEDGNLEPLWFRREELIPEELTEVLVDSIDAEALTDNEDNEDNASDYDDEIVSEESDDD